MQPTTRFSHNYEEPDVLGSSGIFRELRDYALSKKMCLKQAFSPDLHLDHTIDSNGVPLASLTPKSEDVAFKKAGSEVSEDEESLQAGVKETTTLTMPSTRMRSKISAIQDDPQIRLEEGLEIDETGEDLHANIGLELQKADNEHPNAEEGGLKASLKNHGRGKSLKQAMRGPSKRKRNTDLQTQTDQNWLAIAETAEKGPNHGIHDAFHSDRDDKKQTRPLKEQIKTLQDQVDTLKGVALGLQKEVESCKDTIFRLRPSAQIPDSEIISHYESLCASISNWVSAQLADFEERNPSSLKAITSEGNPRWKTLLDRIQVVDEYLVGSLIHDRLHQSFFDSQVPLFGIPKDMETWVQEVEKDMISAEPRKGQFREACDC